VIILVTDGNETESKATLDDAIAAARDADASVYPIAIQSVRFNPAPLKRLAADTGGTYYGAASSNALAAIYSSIAEELQRTWRLEYISAAVPGDDVTVRVGAGGEHAERSLRVPGQLFQSAPEKTRLPRELVTNPGGALALAIAVGLAVRAVLALRGR
jgi:hypothetical protein